MQHTPTPTAELVSVLIPLYNHEQYIEECLESIADEDWSALEVLIYDDCSNDNSATVAQEWINTNSSHFARTEFISGKTNKGIVHALNTLIEEAEGEFVAIVASDDLLTNNGIRERVCQLQNREDWLAVFGDAIAINDNGELTHDSYMFDHFRSVKSHMENDKLRRMEMIVRWSVPGPSAMYRASAFSEKLGVGLFSSSLKVEDRDMYMRLLHSNSLGFTAEVVAKYRLHATNTIRNPEMRIKSMLDRAKPLLDAAKMTDLSRSERAVAGQLAKALLAHAKRRQSTNGLARIGYSLRRIFHIIPARLIASVYFLVNAK
jgi:alpha-1,3-rhamnosyltransferase